VQTASQRAFGHGAIARTANSTVSIAGCSDPLCGFINTAGDDNARAAGDDNAPGRSLLRVAPGTGATLLTRLLMTLLVTAPEAH